jgi:hypothetical protein
MASAELVKTLDYILNRCDEKAIDAVAQAVVRRRRDLALGGGAANLPDPRRMARELSGQISVGASIQGLKKTVMDMAVRIIKKEAPELNDEQIAALTSAWLPGGKQEPERAMPSELLLEMTEQFVGFSTGTMNAAEDKRLRREMGSWPERYWKVFPEIIKLLIKDFLDGELSETKFHSKLRTALSLTEDAR